MITQGTGDYCEYSLSPKFAHIWVTGQRPPASNSKTCANTSIVINSIAVSVAVLAILNTYKRLKSIPEFAKHKPLLKLVSFKLIVGINFFQSFVFSILTGENIIHGSRKVTGKDYVYGIPAILVSVEQIFFAIFFHYSFRSREYHEDMLKEQGVRKMGIFAAAGHAFNPMDLLEGMFNAITMGIRRPSGGSANAGQVSYGRARGKYQQVDDLHLQDGTGYQPYSGADHEAFLNPHPAARYERSRSRSPDPNPPMYQPPSGAPQGRYEACGHQRNESTMSDYETAPRDMV